MLALTIHPLLLCHPQWNMVSLVYSSTIIGGVPKLYANYSVNSGDTWLSAGNLLFNNSSANSAPQYPGMFIYNHAGYLIADSAYLHWLSPVGSAGNYQAYRFGSTHPLNLPWTIINTSGEPG